MKYIVNDVLFSTYSVKNLNINSVILNNQKLIYTEIADLKLENEKLKKAITKMRSKVLNLSFCKPVINKDHIVSVQIEAGQEMDKINIFVTFYIF